MFSYYASCIVLFLTKIEEEKKEKELGWLVLSQCVVANLEVNQLMRQGQWLLFHIFEHLFQKRC
jgi:hypothetical protein